MSIVYKIRKNPYPQYWNFSAGKEFFILHHVHSNELIFIFVQITAKNLYFTLFHGPNL